MTFAQPTTTATAEEHPAMRTHRKPLPKAIEAKLARNIRALVRIDARHGEEGLRDRVAAGAASLFATSRTSYGDVYDRAWELADEQLARHGFEKLAR